MKDFTARCECSVFVEDDWLDEKTTDENAYFDQRELVAREGAYYEWYKAKYGDKKANVLAARANFTQTGLRINDETTLTWTLDASSVALASNGWVTCQYTSDLHKARRLFAVGCTHPNGISRIYAHGTPARGIELVGLAGNIS
jgi:hypothetical protein